MSNASAGGPSSGCVISNRGGLARLKALRDGPTDLVQPWPSRWVQRRSKLNEAEEAEEAVCVVQDHITTVNAAARHIKIQHVRLPPSRETHDIYKQVDFISDMDNPRVPNQGKFLAHGAAAEVWLVDTPADCKCVLKIVRVSLEALGESYFGPIGTREVTRLWEDYTSAFRSKVDQWKPLAHANVIRVLGLDEGLSLRVEYLPCGTASQYLAERPQAPNLLRRKMIGDVLAGLAFLHSQNPPIVHGCIRMDKLFVDYDGTTKIGEFGLASMLEGFG